MIPEAREVRLRRKDRKALEARCRSPVTLQRDLKRARIVLLAAAGHSTRSIAKEVGVQPRIVSLWRHRYADHGLEGLQDKPTSGFCGSWTNRRQKGLHAGPGLCWLVHWAMLTSNMSGGSCAATKSTSRLASPGVRAMTRTLRPKPPMLLASTSPRPRRRLRYAWTRSPRSRLWSERRVI